MVLSIQPISEDNSVSERKSEPETGFIGSLKNLGTAFKDVGKSAAESTSALLEQTEAGRKAKEFGGKAANLAGEFAETVADTTKKIGSNLSGEEAQVQIEALVEQQRRYNDILATRLAEALDRIEKLENQVGNLSRER